MDSKLLNFVLKIVQNANFGAYVIGFYPKIRIKKLAHHSSPVALHAGLLFFIWNQITTTPARSCGCDITALDLRPE